MTISDRSEKSDDPVAFYLRDISSLNPLTREEEQRLAKRGDKKSLDTLVVRNLKYVVRVANRYKGLGMGLPDLINEGNVGLIEAAKRFDPKRDVKFITYAVWWIRQSILRALADQSRVVRLPVKQAGILKKVSLTVSRLTHENSIEPSVEEVAKELRMKPKTLEAVLRVYRDYMSLDSPLSDESDSVRFIDLLATDPEHSVEADYIALRLHHDILQLLSKLSEKEETVLRLRFGFDEPPLTLEQIGARVGLTRERVRQIEKTAKEKLRSRNNLQLLEEYLR
jgi:RNA polymerase primary sigma factor